MTADESNKSADANAMIKIADSMQMLSHAIMTGFNHLVAVNQSNQQPFPQQYPVTRLARLTSAGSRKFCLRLLGCQPGCTIVYYHLKICAHFRGLVLEYFLTKNCHNRIQFLLYY